ncbi:POK18 protein, partial [Drymodes brunneopygia]|nr:POK18 protein [Drymodes brunneopygia]
WNYLGMIITETRIRPEKLKINAQVATVNDVQKLVGDLQWIRNWCGVANEEIQPLFKLLEGLKHPMEP